MAEKAHENDNNEKKVEPNRSNFQHINLPHGDEALARRKHAFDVQSCILVGG